MVKWLFLNHAESAPLLKSLALSCQLRALIMFARRKEERVLSRTLKARPWLNVLLSTAAAMLPLRRKAQVLIC